MSLKFDTVLNKTIVSRACELPKSVCQKPGKQTEYLEQVYVRKIAFECRESISKLFQYIFLQKA